MTDILCRWLNDDVKISKKVDQASFARDFSSGYLLGEVLHKHQLQNDFHLFSQSRTANSKLNNFTLLEPNMHLLGIPFDTNIARDIMTEKYSIVTRLMYQLYIALNNKKKANLTGVAMETQRPAAPAKLNAIESGIYKEKSEDQRLKHITPRQTDLNLEEMASRFHEHQILMEQTAFQDRFVEAELQRQKYQEERIMLLERARLMRAKQSEMVAKIRAAAVNIPKPPPNMTAEALQERKLQRLKREAEESINEIANFENKLKLILPPDDDGVEVDKEYILKRDEDRPENLHLIKMVSNDEYIGKIRKRLEEDALAREEREKRRRKVLVQQLAAHEAREEARREETMVNRLMRQSQQERRIAVQLLQARHEKEVIRNNRIVREQQYQEQRVKDFEEALNREAELARFQKEEYQEQIRQEMECHAMIAAQRAEERYHRHYDLCFETVGQIVDFACKVAEYRELTGKLLPAKLVRDWKVLFESGYPLYEGEPADSGEPTPEQILEEERQLLLDEGDFVEYKNMIGEWSPPETAETREPPRNNRVVGHIIQRLFNMVHPPTPPPSPPKFPPFPVRACVLGKAFSGKTTVLTKLAEENRLQILQVDKLLNEAIEAAKNNELDEAGPNPEGEVQPEAVLADSATGQPGPEPRASPTDASPAADGESGTNKSPIELASKKSSEGAVSREGCKEGVSKSSSQQGQQGVKQDSAEPRLSIRARLGSRAMKYLKKGRPVDDQTVVDILTDAIRCVPEGTGWVIDGFPQNYSQAKLLEKALSGFDIDAKQKPQKSRHSSLVPDPCPPPPPPEPTSSIDVVVLFDIEDKLCLKRARGRTYAVQADQQYHEEFNPPPEGSTTGLGKQEKVNPVTDPAYDQEQLQNRLTAFHDTWGKLEKWFVKFGKLKKVNAADEARAVFLELEKVLEDTISQLQGKDSATPAEQTDAVEEVVEEVSQAAPGAPPEPPPEPPKDETPPGGPDEKQLQSGSNKTGSSGSSKKGGSRDSSKEGKKDKQSKTVSPQRSGSRKSLSMGTSKTVAKGKKSSGKEQTPEPTPDSEQEVDTTPLPQPGDEEWQFVDLDVEQELAAILSNQWEAMENTYVADAKFVFRQVRQEREQIYRYFDHIRKDFLDYLRRPDHKQEFVTQWQREYNAVPDDMRDDDETRAELHQRVDDLRERLWNICDERKEQAERERKAIINDGWLDDHLGILSNHYITLMQAELDRFQDTIRLLKDYYKTMDGQIPDPLNLQYERLPLVELPVEKPKPGERPDSDAQGIASDEAVFKMDSARSPLMKSPRDRTKSSKERIKGESPKEKDKEKEAAKSRSPSPKKQSLSKPEKPELPMESLGIGGAGLRIKIPLVTRRPRSTDGDGKAGALGKDKKKVVKKGMEEGVVSDSPQPPSDPDERMLYDAYISAIVGVEQIHGAEMAAKEAEEEAERLKELEKEKAKSGKLKGKKAGGKNSGSASSGTPPKKGKKDTDADLSSSKSTPGSEEPTEEEKQKKLTRERMRQEYYFSIKEEEMAARTRIDLIKGITMAVIQDLKNRADSAYKDMDDWLGARFLKEMESIDTMSEVLRHSIESGQRLKQQLRLEQEDFLINNDYVILKSPSPAPAPEKVEEATPDHFTVGQLFSLYQQFRTIAPTGILSSKAFVETFENLVAASQGMEQLPDLWMSLTSAQIQELASLLSMPTDYVDWRRFLVALMWSIPTPTQCNLLDTLKTFQQMDQKHFGYVTREQFDTMNLWFDCGGSSGEEYNHTQNMKKILFDIFADPSASPPKMDYVRMLMYFSAMPNSHEGFLRALSMASGTHMPRLQKPLPAGLGLPSNTEHFINSTDNFTSDFNELDEKDERQVLAVEPPMSVEELPAEAIDACVPLDALFRVLHHGEITQGDSHRFSVSADPDDYTSRERLGAVYMDLGYEDLRPARYKVLIEHPIIQDVVVACKTFKALDLKNILSPPVLSVDLNA